MITKALIKTISNSKPPNKTTNKDNTAINNNFFIIQIDINTTKPNLNHIILLFIVIISVYF